MALAIMTEWLASLETVVEPDQLVKNVNELGEGQEAVTPNPLTWVSGTHEAISNIIQNTLVLMDLLKGDTVLMQIPVTKYTQQNCGNRLAVQSLQISPEIPCCCFLRC